MSEQELKKYRLTSMEDPTDEQLEALMAAAGDAVRKRSADTEKMFYAELQRVITERQRANAHGQAD